MPPISFLLEHAALSHHSPGIKLTRRRRRLPEQLPGRPLSMSCPSHKVDKLVAEDDLVPSLIKKVESLSESCMAAQKELRDVRVQLKDAKLRARRTKRKLKLCKEKVSSSKKKVAKLQAECSARDKSLDALGESIERTAHILGTLRAYLEDPLF
nr:uncharacterized protein LOC109777993 [Aegilops tauschii subsp. strangulata]